MKGDFDEKNKCNYDVEFVGDRFYLISPGPQNDVTKDGPLKDLYGKAEQVYHGASLTFNVK